MADYKLLTFLIIMLSINLVTQFWTSALVEANPALQSYADAMNQTPLGRMGNYYHVDSTWYEVNVSDSVDTTTGSVFTDNFKTTQRFFMKQDEKMGIGKGLFSQPGGMMRIMGVPEPIVSGFMFIWYAVAVLLMIGFFTGGGN